MIKKCLFSVALVLTTSVSVQAQTNLRTQFNQALALFNEMVTNKEIGEAIDMIQPGVVLSDAEKAEYNSQVSRNRLERAYAVISLSTSRSLST